MEHSDTAANQAFWWSETSHKHLKMTNFTSHHATEKRSDEDAVSFQPASPFIFPSDSTLFNRIYFLFVVFLLITKIFPICGAFWCFLFPFLMGPWLDPKKQKQPRRENYFRLNWISSFNPGNRTLISWLGMLICVISFKIKTLRSNFFGKNRVSR